MILRRSRGADRESRLATASHASRVAHRAGWMRTVFLLLVFGNLLVFAYAQFAGESATRSRLSGTFAFQLNSSGLSGAQNTIAKGKPITLNIMRITAIRETRKSLSAMSGTTAMTSTRIGRTAIAALLVNRRLPN